MPASRRVACATMVPSGPPTPVLVLTDIVLPPRTTTSLAPRLVVLADRVLVGVASRTSRRLGSTTPRSERKRHSTHAPRVASTIAVSEASRGG